MEATRTPISEQIFGQNKAPLDEVLAKDFAELSTALAGEIGKLSALPAKIKGDVDFATVGQAAIRIRALTTRLDTIRKGETEPLFKAQKAIKAHFDALADKLTAAFAPHQRAADDYTRAKAAEDRRRREEEAKKLREQEERERQKAAEAKSIDTAARAEARAETFGAQADALETDRKAADTVRTSVAGGGIATATTKWDFTIEDYEVIDLNKLRPFLNRDHVETAIRSMVRVQKGNTSLPGVKVFENTRASFR